MNQKSFQAITAMLNAFPQSTADVRALLLTYDKALTGVSDQAIDETALRFLQGEVHNQSKTFAPSVAEFTQEARRIHDFIPYRNKARIAPPPKQFYREPEPIDRIRMGFKMSVLSMGISRHDVDAVALANSQGMDEMMALAQTWAVPIPEELFSRKAA